MHVFTVFDERGLSCLKVNGYGVTGSSSDMECVLQLVQAAALHAQPVLRLQRDLLPPTSTDTPQSLDNFVASLFASVSTAAAEALLSASPPLHPRDLCARASHLQFKRLSHVTPGTCTLDCTRCARSRSGRCGSQKFKSLHNFPYYFAAGQPDRSVRGRQQRPLALRRRHFRHHPSTTQGLLHILR